MSKIDIADLKFLHRNILCCGNANGVVAAVHVTVWRHKNGTILYVPDDPAQLPILKKLMRMEMPDV